MFILGKSLASIGCLFLEHAVEQMPLRAPSIATLVLGAVGGMLCALHRTDRSPALVSKAAAMQEAQGVLKQLSIADQAMSVIFMNAVLMACMSVFEKRTVRLREQSSLGLCLFRNALAAPLLALPVFAGIERLDAAWGSLLDLDAMTWLLMVLSACLSAFAGFLVFELQRFVSATTTQVANLCYTLLTALLSGAVYHNAGDIWAFIGFALSAASVCLYAAPGALAARAKAAAVIDRGILSVEEAVGDKKAATTGAAAAGGTTTSVHVKGAALVVLTLQNSSAPLLMRQSRSTSTVAWIAQTGVIMQELLKGFISLVLIASSGESLSVVVESRQELLRASVPALLYLIQNNLQYVAVTYLDAATYTVTYQLKILSTALMSVMMLNKRLDCEKWAGLVVLVVGVALVQISAASPSEKSRKSEGGSDSSRQVLGLIAVLSACLLSGFAGVYTEKILKGSTVSLWVRNAQLALCSLVIGSFCLLLSGDRVRVLSDGFFVGYNGWTVASVINNSFGGLLIAVVIKYADNILKNFSTAISIILTTLISANFMGLQAGWMFMAGVLTVCGSTFLYGGACRCQALSFLFSRL